MSLLPRNSVQSLRNTRDTIHTQNSIDYFVRLFIFENHKRFIVAIIYYKISKTVSVQNVSKIEFYRPSHIIIYNLTIIARKCNLFGFFFFFGNNRRLAFLVDRFIPNVIIFVRRSSRVLVRVVESETRSERSILFLLRPTFARGKQDPTRILRIYIQYAKPPPSSVIVVSTVPYGRAVAFFV